jgi:hypothetical protein
MEPTNSFLTLESLATLGGTTLATIVVSNTYRAIFKKDPKIFALIFSIAICLLFAVYTHAEPMAYLVAVINGCLVFCTAFGLNNQVSSLIVKGEKSMDVKVPGQITGKFFSAW